MEVAVEPINFRPAAVVAQLLLRDFGEHLALTGNTIGLGGIGADDGCRRLPHGVKSGRLVGDGSIHGTIDANGRRLLGHGERGCIGNQGTKPGFQEVLGWHEDGLPNGQPGIAILANIVLGQGVFLVVLQ